MYNYGSELIKSLIVIKSFFSFLLKLWVFSSYSILIYSCCLYKLLLLIYSYNYLIYLTMSFWIILILLLFQLSGEKSLCLLWYVCGVTKF